MAEFMETKYNGHIHRYVTPTYHRSLYCLLWADTAILWALYIKITMFDVAGMCIDDVFNVGNLAQYHNLTPFYFHIFTLLNKSVTIVLVL